MKKNRIYMLALALVGLSCNVSAHENTIVEIKDGLMQGVHNGSVISYKGIPYAQPPVGDLRWRAPQPVTAWDGVLQAKDYGSDCMQVPFPGDAAPLTGTLSENCLFLNVWQPAEPSRTLRPVMVWIHGGGFVNGGSSAANYDGTSFAQNGIVMVSINYRLGRFGFFAHPALTAANQDPALGNYGLMDQIAALQWVQDNIAHFGGDPNQVTVVGESAGGLSIHGLLTSPLAENLFERAIIQSGAGRRNFSDRYLSHENQFGQTSAETAGLLFAQKFHIEGQGQSALDALRSLPAEDVVGDLSMMNMDSETYTGPMIDGTLITDHPQNIYNAGRGLSVPLLLGATTSEIPVSSPFAEWPETIDQALSIFGPVKAEIAKYAYGVTPETPVTKLVLDIIRDTGMVEPARFVMKAAESQGQSVYGYRFGYIADVLKPTSEGADHASDIVYAFNTLRAQYHDAVTDADQAMAELMHQYWVNFIRNGNPNGPDVPHWSHYRSWADNLMMFSNEGADQSGMVFDPWKVRLMLIESIQPSL
ncbi:carboxylesterase/lipase family protein [Vibrio gazogenes]|uniref:Carboxylic ester hydrolase n=1 Tax=Vibrio gazogenes DSM 21264 = NBRC 103151 TaxID=1123492 RepID=A0A1M4SCM9_VIBGA|nr:carboxylesterase family protein [Vibrio gazogenes]USP15837.1 carboxylesterase family protein [Vibrio gazogenes]SHE30003.1 para-nitrobenzyl esterase [Vibrio gazogenes DSM 21264] [Vibrio gazogenes DSM 21264 = NBRC 103151]SJN58238.1 Para-nitrobenzyl esterase [Vibrio gazogenes]